MEDGTVKLYDFGTAKGLEARKPGTAVVGLTPHYAPPGAFTERKARVGDDLWAVGVMLYEMVAGHRPHSRKEANGGTSAGHCIERTRASRCRPDARRRWPQSSTSS